MPPPISVDEQAKLLLAMINHCTNFKTDWEAVAAESGCGTASAAQQRFGRLSKAFKKGGTEQDGAAKASNKSPVKSGGRKKKTAPAGDLGGDDENATEAPSPVKKRKLSDKAKAQETMNEALKELKGESD